MEKVVVLVWKEMKRAEGAGVSVTEGAGLWPVRRCPVRSLTVAVRGVAGVRGTAQTSKAEILRAKLR